MCNERRFVIFKDFLYLKFLNHFTQKTNIEETAFIWSLQYIWQILISSCKPGKTESELSKNVGNYSSVGRKSTFSFK